MMEPEASNRPGNRQGRLQHHQQLTDSKNGNSSSIKNDNEETWYDATHAERGTIGSFQGDSGPVTGGASSTSTNGRPWQRHQQEESIDNDHNDCSGGSLGKSFMRIGSVMGSPCTPSVMFDEHRWDRRNFETMGSIDMKIKLQNVTTADDTFSNQPSSSSPIQVLQQPQSKPRKNEEGCTDVLNSGSSTDGREETTTEVLVNSTQTSFVCTIPPSAGSPWSASFAGTSGLMVRGGGGLGYAKTNVSLGYDILHGKTLICDWRTGGDVSGGGEASLSSPKLSCGAVIRSSFGGDSLTQIKIHNLPYYRTTISSTSLPSTNNPPALSVCNSRYWINDKIHGVIEFGLLGSLLQRQHQYTQPDRERRKLNNVPWKSSPLQFVRLGFATTNVDHTTNDAESTNSTGTRVDNNKSSSLPNIRLNLDWGVDKLPFKLWYNNNSHNDQRRIEFYLALGYARRFDTMALVTQALTPFTTMSVGMGRSSWLGLSWMFRLRSGTFSLNIPIHLSSAPFTLSQSVMHYAVSAYVAFWTGMIHLALSDWIEGRIGGNGGACSYGSSDVGGEQRATSSKDSLEEDLLLPQLRREKDMLLLHQEQHMIKARNDAKSQTLLMKRKADTNRKVEDEKNGLVIAEATYGIDGGDRMDATVQLQFWVIDSKLQLAATSKGNMLGFYNIEDTCQKDKAIRGSEGISSVFGIVALWKDLVRQDPKKEENKMAYLAVRYRFNDQLYDVTIWDNEALTLPSPRAIVVQSFL